MALSWNIENCRNVDSLFAHDDNGDRNGLKVWVDAAVWRCMSTKIQVITTQTVAEFYIRNIILDEVQGPAFFSVEGGERVPESLSFEQCAKLIGLSTNVISKPRQEWIESHVAPRIEDYHDFDDLGLPEIASTPFGQADAAQYEHHRTYDQTGSDEKALWLDAAPPEEVPGPETI